MTHEDLISKALEARKMAYTPYSHHAVGAALLTKDGKVYLGCNIENAAYTPTNCAERTALFKAVSEGEREFSAIAIVGGPDNQEELPICAPCGVCRQALNEFVDPETFEVILGTNDPKNYKIFKLAELLPLGFGPKNMSFLKDYQ
ncbi:cytidine deaminase [Butyrivibrio sp. ob235]|uniref:cytidine deaminase n=1 Tax=Butyrivibrio sp. ob235 TaxID=1761780 RepID=UPI0008B95C38|nr:cytidine deaminase [Butyrivibrio sp. ob235]SEK88911.1 cytidine deaminase [Butyrivibrio sp. ob235]